MYYVYILQSQKDKSYYTGFSEDLKQRIKTHNSSGKKFTTRKNGIWILIYAEAYQSKQDAYNREQKLKVHGSGKIELIKRLKNSLLDIRSGEGRS